MLFGNFNSPKKRMKNFDFTTTVPQVKMFSFVFGRIEDTKKTFRNLVSIVWDNKSIQKLSNIYLFCQAGWLRRNGIGLGLLSVAVYSANWDALLGGKKCKQTAIDNTFYWFQWHHPLITKLSFFLNFNDFKVPLYSIFRFEQNNFYQNYEIRGWKSSKRSNFHFLEFLWPFQKT